MQSVTGKQFGTGSEEYVISSKRGGGLEEADCNYRRKFWPAFHAGNLSLLRLQMGRVSLWFLKGYLAAFWGEVISSEFLLYCCNSLVS